METLQEELKLMQGEVSSFMMVFEGLMKNDASACTEDYDVIPCNMDHLHSIVST